MGKTVLVVDDDTLCREAVAALLRREGYATLMAADGRQADQILLRWQADVILLDMLMPTDDGWDFLNRRKGVPDLLAIPVVIITGLAVASEPWAEALGAVGLIPKPIDPDELMSMLREVAGGRS
jgi:CheY-like chemotaxis protein